VGSSALPPDPESSAPESSEPCPELPESSAPDPLESSAPGSSEPCPELPESFETDLEPLESSGLVPSGTLNSGAFEICDVDGDVDGSVVDVVVLVVDVELVVDATTVGTGSSGGTGFCHTDRDVGAPMLGNNVSRMA
jgi:hypothetical protein